MAFCPFHSNILTSLGIFHFSVHLSLQTPHHQTQTFLQYFSMSSPRKGTGMRVIPFLSETSVSQMTVSLSTTAFSNTSSAATWNAISNPSDSRAEKNLSFLSSLPPPSLQCAWATLARGRCSSKLYLLPIHKLPANRLLCLISIEDLHPIYKLSFDESKILLCNRFYDEAKVFFFKFVYSSCQTRYRYLLNKHVVLKQCGM